MAMDPQPIMSNSPSSHTHLYGSCACERNQYAIAIPAEHHREAQTPARVFFDNSRANRRSQAAPLTAWLRVPLAWYHSNTQAYYPDESHASIRRTFYTPAPLAGAGAGGRQVRKQFCGYCGTHLNAWREEGEDHGGDNNSGGGSRGAGEWMDVTLGSLWGESMALLGDLGWLDGGSSSSSSSSSDEEEEAGEKIAFGGLGGGMRNRGMPYFEEMVEDSRLGRIKRRRGGGASADGSSRVEWVVTEIEGGDEDTVMQEQTVVESGGGNGNKRLKLGD